MNISGAPSPEPTTTLSRLPLRLPQAMLAWLIWPAALVKVGLTPRRVGTGLAPNVVIMPMALVLGTIENLYLAQLRLRAGTPVDLPGLGAFDLRNPQLAAAIMALAEIAAFYLVALVPLWLAVRVAGNPALDHFLPALTMRFAALASLWLTALTTLRHLAAIPETPYHVAALLLIGLPGLRYIWIAMRALPGTARG